MAVSSYLEAYGFQHTRIMIVPYLLRGVATKARSVQYNYIITSRSWAGRYGPEHTYNITILFLKGSKKFDRLHWKSTNSTTQPGRCHSTTTMQLTSCVGGANPPPARLHSTWPLPGQWKGRGNGQTPEWNQQGSQAKYCPRKPPGNKACIN